MTKLQLQQRQPIIKIFSWWKRSPDSQDGPEISSGLGASVWLCYRRLKFSAINIRISHIAIIGRLGVHLLILIATQPRSGLPGRTSTGVVHVDGLICAWKVIGGIWGPRTLIVERRSFAAGGHRSTYTGTLRRRRVLIYPDCGGD